MTLDPLNTFKAYLALKNHFVNPKYDFHKYNGKVKANLDTFYKRNDRFFFEKLSRQKSDQEIIDFFVSNFVSCSNPQSLWIGDIVKEGEKNYKNWSKKIQSLTYIFKEEVNSVFANQKIDDLFKIEKNRHPQILKEYLQGKLSLETMVILNRILSYQQDFDKKLLDPIWEFVSMRITKYDKFLTLDSFKYRKILKEIFL